jgi:hypothetical protein
LIAAMTLELGLGIIDGRLLGYVTKKTVIYRINGANQDFIDRKEHKSITTLHVLDARKSNSGLHYPQDFYLESEIKKSDNNTADAKVRVETEMVHNRCSNW